MAIKLGKLLIYCISFTISLFLFGCACTPTQIECAPCPVCDCKDCDYLDMGCVDVDDTNTIINFTNMLLEVFNENTEGENFTPLRFFPKLEEAPKWQ